MDRLKIVQQHFSRWLLQLCRFFPGPWRCPGTGARIPPAGERVGILDRTWNLNSGDNSYHLAELHLFERLGKNILFNVDSMVFYEINLLTRDLVMRLARSNKIDAIRQLTHQYGKRAVRNTWMHLEQEGVVQKGPSPSHKSMPKLPRRFGLRHLELLVTHSCNLRCSYCYGSYGDKGWEKAHHLYGSETSGMSLQIAQRGVDFLFDNSGPQKEISVIFFGGEPLLEFNLIRQIVSYVRSREAASKRKAVLSLSTNGLPLTDEVIDFLVSNRVGCQISIDGPAAIHNVHRRTADGRGSYDRMLPRVRKLIARRPGKVPARVTVAKDLVKIPEVLDHLLELGFGSVHIEPSIGGSAGTAITSEDTQEIKRQNEEMARFLIDSVRSNRIFYYTNLVRFVRSTRLVQNRLAYHCGAGRTYLALAQEGSFYPCHRFVGMADYRMGDVWKGVDWTLRESILDLSVDQREGCRCCWARYLCGGGCWKHAVDMNGCLELADQDFSCELIRHQIECAMAVNSELKVEDQTLLSTSYEKFAEPYLLPEKENRPDA